MTKQEIIKWLSERSIEMQPNSNVICNYVVNSDNSVSFSTFFNNVNFNGFAIFELPFKIQECHKNFLMQSCELNSLINFPEIVNGNCVVRRNNLTNLKDCPKQIDGNFYVDHNPITTWQYLPELVGGTMTIDSIDIPDPYDWRHFLFKNIKLRIIDSQMGTKADYVYDIIDILNKYLGKSDQFHIAIDELMNLGESRGFTYD